MSHFVATRCFYYCNGSEKQKKSIQKVLDDYATHNGDGQIGLGSNINWTSMEFESFDEAQDWLENHEGFYWQGAAKFKVYEKSANSKFERFEKKIDSLNQKLAKAKADMTDYVEKNNVKNRKSIYVGCQNCGSKLHKDYIPLQMYSQNCPLCHTDLFSETAKNRIKAYRSQIDYLNKQIEQTKKDMEKSKRTCKFTWWWAVKFEFHCQTIVKKNEK